MGINYIKAKWLKTISYFLFSDPKPRTKESVKQLVSRIIDECLDEARQRCLDDEANQGIVLRERPSKSTHTMKLRDRRQIKGKFEKYGHPFVFTGAMTDSKFNKLFNSEPNRPLK